MAAPLSRKPLHSKTASVPGVMFNRMDYGNWKNSIVKSVSLGFFALVLYGLGMQVVQGEFFQAHENMLLLAITFVVYFGLSASGWVLVGIPTHFVLCRWFSPRYQYYALACLIVSLVLVILRGFASSAVFIIVIFLQAGLFRYYVFSKKT
jgi:hypothetical protein